MNKISVSNLVKLFEPDIDWSKKALNASRKLRSKGIAKTVSDVMDDWDKKRKLGAKAGKQVHLIKEGKDPKTIPLTPLDDSYVAPLYIQNGFSYEELYIYDNELGITGISDKVEVYNDYINITDYKTDIAIYKRGFSTDWSSSLKLKEPLGHLDYCNFNLYSLKMSLYMYLLSKAHYGRLKPGKIKIVWCEIERDEDGYPIFTDGIPTIIREKTINVPYRKKEVLKMIEHVRKDI